MNPFRGHWGHSQDWRTHKGAGCPCLGDSKLQEWLNRFFGGTATRKPVCSITAWNHSSLCYLVRFGLVWLTLGGAVRAVLPSWHFWQDRVSVGETIPQRAVGWTMDGLKNKCPLQSSYADYQLRYLNTRVPLGRDKYMDEDAKSQFAMETPSGLFDPKRVDFLS